MTLLLILILWPGLYRSLSWISSSFSCLMRLIYWASTFTSHNPVLISLLRSQHRNSLTGGSSQSTLLYLNSKGLPACLVGTRTRLTILTCRLLGLGAGGGVSSSMKQGNPILEISGWLRGQEKLTQLFLLFARVMAIKLRRLLRLLSCLTGQLSIVCAFQLRLLNCALDSTRLIEGCLLEDSDKLMSLTQPQFFYVSISIVYFRRLIAKPPLYESFCTPAEKSYHWQGLSGISKPQQDSGAVGEFEGQPVPYPLVVLVDMLDVWPCEQSSLKQVPVVGAQGEILEPKQVLPDFPHDQHVLDPDAVLARTVVAGLVGHDHTWLQHCLVQPADPDGPFMH